MPFKLYKNKIVFRSTYASINSPISSHWSFPRDNFFRDLWLGKDARAYGGANSIVGELTDFHAWNRVLSVDEMTEWTRCTGNTLKGNLVAWEGVRLGVEL